MSEDSYLCSTEGGFHKLVPGTWSEKYVMVDARLLYTV